MMIEWKDLAFEKLSAREVYDLLHLRAEVFVVEQQAAYLDVDYRDLQCRHVLGYADGKLLAHCRVFPVGGYFEGQACIGRVVTSPSARGTGIGHELIERGIACSIAFNGNTAITISAQLRLRRFYEAHGFVKTSATYQEDGITHIHMTRQPKPQQ